jgi:hypothetical protein
MNHLALSLSIVIITVAVLVRIIVVGINGILRMPRDWVLVAA